jgi:hypothetical protein
MAEQTFHSFLIQRSVVKLKVSILPSGLVSIEPYQCKPENLRLWQTIARTQATLAQLQLEANKTSSPYPILFATFEKQGWDIKHEIEPLDA